MGRKGKRKKESRKWEKQNIKDRNKGVDGKNGRMGLRRKEKG
jgi:hypothetical protein